VSFTTNWKEKYTVFSCKAVEPSRIIGRVIEIPRARTITFSVKQDVTELVEKYQKYAWILHDRDVDIETGEIKDPHYHYFIEFPNARHLSGVAKEFEILESMIEVVRNKVGILRYFTHSTPASKEKYQYDISEVHSSFDIEAATEENDMLTYFEIISKSKNVVDAIKKIQSIGYTGNPLVGVSYIVKIYQSIHGNNSIYFGINDNE